MAWNQNGSLDRLPVEILVHVFQQLKLSDQYALQQASRYTRAVLSDEFKSLSLQRAPPRAILGYLVRRAYALPDFWTCEQCLDLHRVGLIDKHKGPKGCPRAAHEANFVPSFHPYGYNYLHYTLEYRQVSLALKYARLGGFQGLFGDRLHLLLTEHYYSFQVKTMLLSSEIQSPGHVRYKCTPRIIAGRFLLHTDLYFFGTTMDARGLDGTPAMRLCQHQQWIPHCVKRLLYIHARAGVLTQEQAEELPKLKWLQSGDLYHAMMALLATPDEKRTAVSCPTCPTDIYVERSAGGIS